MVPGHMLARLPKSAKLLLEQSSTSHSKTIPSDAWMVQARPERPYSFAALAGKFYEIIIIFCVLSHFRARFC